MKALEFDRVGKERVLAKALNGENFIKEAMALAKMSYSQAPVNTLAA